MLLTLVFWPFDQFSHHGLKHSRVAVQYTTYHSTQECYPEIGGEADDEQRKHRPSAAQEKDRFATDPVRKRAPEEASEGFGKGESRDENTGVEGGIAEFTDVKAFDEQPSIGKDGGQSNWLSESDECWKQLDRVTSE